MQNSIARSRRRLQEKREEALKGYPKFVPTPGKGQSVEIEHGDPMMFFINRGQAVRLTVTAGVCTFTTRDEQDKAHRNFFRVGDS